MQKKENDEVIVEIKKSDRVSNKMQSITGAGVCVDCVMYISIIAIIFHFESH